VEKARSPSQHRPGLAQRCIGEPLLAAKSVGRNYASAQRHTRRRSGSQPAHRGVNNKQPAEATPSPPQRTTRAKTADRTMRYAFPNNDRFDSVEVKQEEEEIARQGQAHE